MRRAWLGGWLVVLAAVPARAVEDLRITVLPVTEPGTYAMEVRGMLAAPPLAVRHVVMRYCDDRQRFAYLDECVNFRVSGDTSWTYGLINPPIIASRDYVIAGRVPQDLAPDGSGRFRMEWWEDEAGGPVPRPGVIRTRINEGFYTLVPAAGGRQTALVYRLKLAPGGWVPLWVARLAGRRTAAEQMERIERLAQEKDRARTVGLPTPGNPWSWVRPGTPAVPLAITPTPTAPPP